MTPRLLPVLPLVLAACSPADLPQAKVTMTIGVRVAEGSGIGSVTVNGDPRGPAPVDLDVEGLAFDPALTPKAWPPPGAQSFEPTVSKHGSKESSLTIALSGDIVYVRRIAAGVETMGGIRLKVTAPEGSSLEFDSAEKELTSGLGRAKHTVRLLYKRRR